MSRITFNSRGVGGAGAGGGSGATKNDIITDLAVGASGANETIPSGTDLEAYIRTTRNTIFEPTIQNPSLIRSISGAMAREVGEALSETITLTLNRGNIVGKLVSGIWNTGTSQNPRSGVATQYTIDGNANGISNSRAVARTIVLGSNTFGCSVNYADGPQPTNSASVNSATWNILPAGTLTLDLTVSGFYRRFWGPVATASTTSAHVRALSNTALNNASNSFTLATGNVQSIFEIWVPADKSLASVIDVDALNLNVTANYVLAALGTINDANGDSYAGKLYRMTNAGPYSTSHNHNVTLS